MVAFANRIFRLREGEWPKLLQFGLFGFLLQMGVGVGFSAGDAAFLSNEGADSLPLVFILTPLVMVFYTAIFSYLLVRFSIDHTVDFTLAALMVGGATLWALMNGGLPAGWESTIYIGLKLYLAMWYIALYSLFWNYTDTYFDIQDAKRLFPLFAAFCALGTATGALIVSLFAASVPMHYFFLLWAFIAVATAPLARLLRRRWSQIAESDTDLDEEAGGAFKQLATAAKAFRGSRFTMVFTLTLFFTLLMTNLAEFQYSKVLQEGRTEAELAALLGTLYAAANIFNLVICLFVFNRLVARFGVRNVAFVQPFIYFAVFGYFFLEGGTGAALAAFFAYHGILTSIEYNNENLLFNAVPSKQKRTLRTVVEGLCEPLASLVAGAFLLYAANQVDMRELSGIGIIIGAVLIAVVIALRQLYPTAMAANMRQGWLNFGDRRFTHPEFDAKALALLKDGAAKAGTPQAEISAGLLDAQSAPTVAIGEPADVDALMLRLHDADPVARAQAVDALVSTATEEDIHIVSPLATQLPALSRNDRQQVISLLGRICDAEAISDIVSVASQLAPRERRAISLMLSEIGETAIPRLISILRDRTRPYLERAIAARALAQLSYAQFASQLDQLVNAELLDANQLLADARDLEANAGEDTSIALLARAQRERVAASVDFALELFAIGGLLPNFDLLIVSLHSANAKVRGNAIETIESGLNAERFGLLEPLLSSGEIAAIDGQPKSNITAILEAALHGAAPLEAACAADALRTRLGESEFNARLRSVIAPDMPEFLRSHIAGMLGLGEGHGQSCLAIVAALGQHPDLGGATLESLTALAVNAQSDEPEDRATRHEAGGVPFWIRQQDLDEVACRYPDLALVILKSQDDRRYAA